MKRTSLFVALALTIVFALAVVNVNKASGWWSPASHDHDHGKNQHANHPPNTQQQQLQKQPFVDGATNPEAIPDSVARELVLRLLTSDELTEGDKRAYLKEVGFDEAASSALTFAAHDFKRQTAGIEKEASEIKDRTWPTPDKATLAQLADLQRQKEEILSNNAAELDGRLRNFNALASWENYITNRVKRKTKGFQVGMPMKKIGFYQKIFDPFAAYAQAPGCDANIFVFSETYINWDTEEAIGSTSYSVPANNCGHTFTPRSTIWGPGGYGGEGNRIPLFYGGVYRDGLFETGSNVEGFCPVVSETFNAGGNASNLTVAGYLLVKPWGNFNPTTINNNGSSNISIQISASAPNGGGNYNINCAADPQTSGSMIFDITGCGNKSIGAGAVLTITANYKPLIINTLPARIKAKGEVTSAEKTVQNGSQTSASILTIN